MEPNRSADTPDPDLAAAFAAIEADHPGWHCWKAVIPALVYARRPNSSPPRVVRAPDADRLRKAIEDDEHRWYERHGGWPR